MTTQHSGASSATPRRAAKQQLAFIEDLPEHLRLFYKDVAHALMDRYALSKKGIGFKGTGTVVVPPFCSPFRVTSLVRDSNSDNWARVIEVVNPDAKIFECVVPDETFERNPRNVLAIMAKRGFRVFNEKHAITIRQIIRNWDVPADKRRVLIGKIGWTANHDAFITSSGGVITRNDETPQYHFAGDIDGKDAGDLKAWREGVAALAAGNTNLVFAIALGFSTALLPFTDLASLIFHLFGQTSKGKTRVLRAGLTVWPKIGENDKTWSATINGLEGEVARSNHILFGLDELPKDAPAELGNMIYTIANSAGKVRGKIDGSAKKRATWNTFVISTGEHSMITTLSKLGNIATGGQGVRMLDIPVDGSYGAFDYLHGHATSDAFVRALDVAIRDASGPAGAEFIQNLIRIPLEELTVSLKNASEQQAKALYAHFGVIAGDEKTREIRRVLDAFALIAVAGEKATEFGLTGWMQGTASDAVKTIAQRWLDRRGTMALDKRESIKLISDYLTENELRFVPIGEAKPVLSDQEWPPGYQDEEYFYVLPSTMSKIYIEKSKLPVSLNHLVEEDYLFKGGERSSMQFKMKQIGAHRPRAYRIRRSILDFNASIDNASATTRETPKGQE